MTEKKGDAEYVKLMTAANRELLRIYRGHRQECIHWLGKCSPFWVAMMSYLLLELQRGVGVLPLPVFQKLQGTFLALNRQIFAMWLERDWFDLHGQPIPPDIH
jgi:hypothetical protein